MTGLHEASCLTVLLDALPYSVTLLTRYTLFSKPVQCATDCLRGGG